MMSPADLRLAKLRIAAQAIAAFANEDEVANRLAGVVRGMTNEDVKIVVTQLKIEAQNLMVDSLGLV